MFHTARERLLRQGNVCSLPYEDGTFDAVTAFETVYFWSPIKTALAEAGFSSVKTIHEKEELHIIAHK